MYYTTHSLFLSLSHTLTHTHTHTHSLSYTHSLTCTYTLSLPLSLTHTLFLSISLTGVDDEKGAQVFKVDPAGHYLPYKAVATGKAEQEAMNFLEKKVDVLSNLNENETIELAISAMQYVLSTDFKSTEIEVGIVSVGSKFRVLKEDEIEERLNSIAEKSDS